MIYIIGYKKIASFSSLRFNTNIEELT